MERFKEDFPTKLKGIDFQTLENSKDSVFGLSKDLKLIYFNPGWILFAEENGSSERVLKEFPLDTPIAKALRGKKLKEFYLENYNYVLSSGKPWHQEYECSSTDEIRRYCQSVYPLKDGEGLIVINRMTIQFDRANIQPKPELSMSHYIQSSGFMTQCSNCRHTLRSAELDIWDWVPSLVENLPDNVSHSICPICMDYYWKYGRMKYPDDTLPDS